MMRWLVVSFALLAAACSPPAQQAAPKTEMQDMGASAPTAAGPIQSSGMVTAVDASAGTVSLDHEAIPAVNWPAMSMQFQVEPPAKLDGIAVGDRVSFQLKSAKETGVITSIQKQ